MSKIYKFPRQEALYDEASAWVAKLDRQLSHSEEDALKHWISQSAKHRDLLFHMAAVWDRMDSLSRLSSLFPPPTKQAPRFSFAKACAIAASLLVASTAGFWGVTTYAPDAAHRWMSWEKATAVESTYETNIGEHSTVNLPDGSQLVLNTNSLIKVKYSNNSRLLHLLRGEVHIQVAHDSARPLSVIAVDRVVQAVGTAFNVQIFDQQLVELIVTEGKVRVANRSREDNFDALENTRLPDSAVAISQGEKIVLGSQGDGGDVIAKIDTHDIEADLSWRSGNLIFRGETLEQALGEISRYTEVEFDIADNEIKDLRIAGLFKAGDINGLLSTLDKNFNIKYEKLSPDRVSLRGAKK